MDAAETQSSIDLDDLYPHDTCHFFRNGVLFVSHFFSTVIRMLYLFGTAFGMNGTGRRSQALAAGFSSRVSDRFTQTTHESLVSCEVTLGRIGIGITY